MLGLKKIRILSSLKFHTMYVLPPQKKQKKTTKKTRQSVAVQREGASRLAKRYYILIRALELTLQGQPRSNVVVQISQ